MRTTSLVALALSMLCIGPAAWAQESGWFVSLPKATVTPVPRSETHRLLDGGVIKTDGFSHLTFSFGGEFKDGVPESGTIGAILVPDNPTILYLLQNEGQILFALEVKFVAGPGQNPIFVSEQQTMRVAFPQYRVFFYNETSSTAVVSLSVYRSRG